MIAVALDDEADVAGWRAAARRLLAEGVAPEEATWRVGAAAVDLFGDGARDLGAAAPSPLRVSRACLDLIDRAIRHRDPERFALLYRLVWRLRATPGLLDVASDPLVRRIEAMAKAVRRDRHKMTAFVRFREAPDADGAARFVAWFEPEHFIEELAAPFFVDRYAAMRFTIVTPRKAIDWTDGALTFGPGGRRSDAPEGDGFAAAWDVYYRSTFNPARLGQRAMLKEMPKKYWANLPETRAIPALVAGAQARVETFLAAPASEPSVRRERLAARRVVAPAPAPADALAALREEAQACRRCPIGACATQIVFGEGPAQARLMIVAEQPGDREDLVGRPLVGPAGEMFDAALAEAGIDRAKSYVTAAVKHFKFEPRGKRRLHKTPNAGEIEACRWWLARELELVRAPVVLAMGRTALRALTGETGPLAEARGRVLPFRDGRRLVATVHPAYLLRLPDPALAQAERRAFVDDLRRAAALAGEAAAA